MSSADCGAQAEIKVNSIGPSLWSAMYCVILASWEMPPIAPCLRQMSE